jgi:hydroxyacylglutathione hydrolase
MEHVVTSPRPPFRTASGALEIHQVPSFRDNLIWLLVCTKTGAAAAIDGPEAKSALAYCETQGIELSAVFNTHTHPDHIGINFGLLKTGRPLRVAGAKTRAKEIPGLNEGLEAGDTLTLGASTGRVLLTEGHIDDHLSFVFEDVVFCGDTMFGAGCGYLFDGPPAKMMGSLAQLAELEGSTRVCCAHEYTEDNLRFAWSVEPDNDALAARIRDTWALRARGECSVPGTIEVERATNPFLRHHAPTLRKRVAAAFPDQTLTTDLEFFTATRALKDRKDHQSLTDADLPL